MNGTGDESRRSSRRFRGPFAHYSRPVADAGVDEEIALDNELGSFDELGIREEQSGVRKRIVEPRSVPPPLPHHAKRRVRAPLGRDLQPVDFDALLLLHPPPAFGGDAIVPPSPGIPVFRALVIEAADRESFVTRTFASALESLGELGLDLVAKAYRFGSRAIAPRTWRPHPRPSGAGVFHFRRGVAGWWWSA